MHSYRQCAGAEHFNNRLYQFNINGVNGLIYFTKNAELGNLFLAVQFTINRKFFLNSKTLKTK